MEIAEAIKRLETFINGKQLVQKGEKLILGVSGGADSTAMLYLFCRLRPLYEFSLLAVHINHQMRGVESDSDEAAVKKLCLALNVPLIVRKVQIAHHDSRENQARKARFSIFDEVMANYCYDKILLAHHREDQAETVLLNMLRGSGISGMSGIKPTLGIVVHPMLCFNRSDLESLLGKVGINWCIDKSNQDNNFTRNRIRNDLLPKLQTEYNPSIKNHLCSLAEIFLEADDLLAQRSKKQQRRLTIEYSPTRIVLELKPLLKLTPIERYYIFRNSFRMVAQLETDFLSAHFMAIEDVISASGSKMLDLPHGVKIKKLYEELIFSRDTEITDNADSYIEIDADRARAVFGNFRFTFKYLRIIPPLPEPDEQSMQIVIDAEKLKLPFRIRYRQPGDRFIPLGMNQFKKLKEFFIDEKVPKYERDLLPIFDDGEKIFWIVGHRIDNRVRRDESSSRYLQIVAEPLNARPNRAIKKKKRGNDESDEL